jgi:hypothetical protein
LNGDRGSSPYTCSDRKGLGDLYEPRLSQGLEYNYGGPLVRRPADETGDKISLFTPSLFFPISIEPFIEELVPLKKIVLTGSKFYITARHEFIFDESEEGVSVTSREFFWGITFLVLGFAFPAWRIRELTRALLQDLKRAAER